MRDGSTEVTVLAALRADAKIDERARRVLIDYLMANRQRPPGKRAYTATRYPGKLGSLTIGAIYHLLPDGRISRFPTSTAQGVVQVIGVAITRTTIALTGAPVAFGGDGRLYDYAGAIENLASPIFSAGVIRVSDIVEAP